MDTQRKSLSFRKTFPPKNLYTHLGLILPVASKQILSKYQNRLLNLNQNV